MKRVAVLLNPSSRQGRSLAQKESIEETLKALGIVYQLWVSESEAHLRQLAVECGRRFPVVVGVGGDTTFNIIAAQVLDMCPAPVLGMIGTGSANDIMRGLGLASISKSCQAIASWSVKKMDVGFLKLTLADGNKQRFYFLGTVSAGLGTTVNAHVASKQQQPSWFYRLNPLGRLCAGLAGIRRSFQMPHFPIPARLIYHDIPSDRRVERAITFSLLVFLNTPYYADGLKLAPGAVDTALFDGLLDGCVIHSTSFLNTLKVGLSVPRGRHPYQKEVFLCQANAFTVLPELPIDIQIDGEIIPRVQQFEVSLAPGLLKILA